MVGVQKKGKYNDTIENPAFPPAAALSRMTTGLQVQSSCPALETQVVSWTRMSVESARQVVGRSLERKT